MVWMPLSDSMCAINLTQQSFGYSSLFIIKKAPAGAGLIVKSAGLANNNVPISDVDCRTSASSV